MQRSRSTSNNKDVFGVFRAQDDGAEGWRSGHVILLGALFFRGDIDLAVSDLSDERVNTINGGSVFDVPRAYVEAG